jgi:hypothetical protein
MRTLFQRRRARQPDCPHGGSKGGRKDYGAGKRGVLRRSCCALPFVEQVFADGGNAGRFVGWAQDKAHALLEIVQRPRGANGFVVIRRPLVVEWTFAWIMKCRRLVRDHEYITRVAETTVDFEHFRPWLVEGLGYDYGDGAKGGRPPFDPVSIFKALIPQRA